MKLVAVIHVKILLRYRYIWLDKVLTKDVLNCKIEGVHKMNKMV